MNASGARPQPPCGEVGALLAHAPHCSTSPRIRSGVQASPFTSRRVVLLLHEGHGAAHIDLLIERDDGPLVTYRAPVGVSLLLDGGHEAAFDAERLPEHRRVYLDYEGAVSNNRGSVRRIATLSLVSFAESPTGVRFQVSPHPSSPISFSSPSSWSASLVSSGLWRFTGRGRLE